MSTSNSSTAIDRASVVIVGAGPGGTAAALRLAQLGVRDLVLVDLHDFPREKTCGSGLSPRAIATLKELGVWDRIEPIAYPIIGTRIVSPGGCETWVSGGERAGAAICLRRDFDYALHRHTLELGVRFVPQFRAKTPITKRDAAGRPRWAGIRAADGREIRADFVAVANGAHSTLTTVKGPKRTIHTIMGWWENVEYRPNHVEMLWDEVVRPCYGWLFPETESRVNIGITYDDDDKVKNARVLFHSFLDRHFKERLADAKPIGKFKGHPIVYCYRPRQLTSPGRIVIGEAGRMPIRQRARASITRCIPACWPPRQSSRFSRAAAMKRGHSHPTSASRRADSPLPSGRARPFAVYSAPRCSMRGSSSGPRRACSARPRECWRASSTRVSL
jgi:flavin-dependent dehydrogenase